MFKAVVITTLLLSLSLVTQIAYTAESCSNFPGVPLMRALQFPLPSLSTVLQAPVQASKLVKEKEISQEAARSKNIGKNVRALFKRPSRIIKSSKKSAKKTSTKIRTTKRLLNFVNRLAKVENSPLECSNPSRQDIKDVPQALYMQTVSILEQLSEALNTMKLILDQAINARKVGANSVNSSDLFVNITNNFIKILASLQYIKENIDFNDVHELAEYSTDTLKKINDAAVLVGNNNASIELSALIDQFASI